MHDELLDKLVGKWHIERHFPNRKAENTANIRWVLDGHWLLIDMKGGKKPAYEAHVYITRMESDGSYPIHWLDNFGGTVPEMKGLGHRDGESIVFDFTDEDSKLRNTFTWHPDLRAWTSQIDQTDKDGKWSPFCTDTYTKEK